jgi:hypothetical protein
VALDSVAALVVQVVIYLWLTSYPSATSSQTDEPSFDRS